MKLAADDGIVGVQTCTEHDDILLTTRLRQVHPLLDRRMCAYSRAAIPPACAASSSAKGDEVVSLSLLHHSDATTRGSARLSEAGECGAPGQKRRRRRSVDGGPVGR